MKFPRSMNLAIPASLGLTAVSGLAAPSAPLAGEDVVMDSQAISAKDAAVLVEEDTSGSVMDNFHVSLRGEVKYDDNIFLSPDQEEGDTIFTLIPVIGYNSARGRVAKNSFAVRYAPEIAFYADNSNLDRYNNNASIDVRRQLTKTELALDVDYTERSDASRFINDTTDRSIFLADFEGSHILSGKTRLDFGAGYNQSDYDDDALFDYDGWTADIAVLYRITGKTSIGPYVNGGQTFVSGENPDHKFWGVGGKVDYQFTGKTRFSGTIGYENRGFSGDLAAGDKSTMVWNLGLDHRLTGKTKLNALIYQKNNPSVNIAGSGYEATGIAIGSTYRASTNLSFNGGLTYEHNKYFQTIEGADTSRKNDYWKLSLGGVWAATDKLDVGGRVLYRLNNSSDADNEFDNFQIALDATYKFW